MIVILIFLIFRPVYDKGSLWHFPHFFLITPNDRALTSSAFYWKDRIVMMRDLDSSLSSFYPVHEFPL